MGNLCCCVQNRNQIELNRSKFLGTVPQKQAQQYKQVEPRPTYTPKHSQNGLNVISEETNSVDDDNNNQTAIDQYIDGLKEQQK